MIALTLLGLILALGFAGLRTGLRSWESVEAATQLAADRRAVEGFLRRQIGQARPALLVDARPGEPGLAFRGEANRLEFVAPLPQRDRIGGLYRFTVAIRESDEGKELHLSYQLHLPNVVPAEDGEQTRVLLSELADGTFSYFGALDPNTGADWHETWVEAHDLPRLVRLRATSAGTGDDTAGLDLTIPIWPAADRPAGVRTAGVPRR